MEALRKIIKYLLIVIILFVAAFSTFFSIKRLNSQQLGIVKEISTERVVRVFTKEYNFVPEGILPMLYSVYQIPGRRSIINDISVEPPALAELANPRYKIIIPVTIIFEINSADPAAVDFVLDKVDSIDDEIVKIATLLYSKEIESYLKPQYNKNRILKNVKNIENNVSGVLKSLLKKIGCELISLSVTGAVIAPESDEYYQGLKHIAELHKIEENNENRLKNLKSILERDELNNKQYYKKLTEISALLKQNPDLIKYIYIDKLADKIKVVPSIKDIDSLSSNRNDSVTPSQGKGEIDNLR